MTEEHKRKIGEANSEIMKKKWQDLEYRKMMEKSQKGHKLSEETKRKLSEARKGKKLPPFSEEHKKNLSKALKGRIAWNKGKKCPSISKTKMGHTTSEEARKKMSEAKRGEKSYTWKGGVTSENQRIRHSIEIRLWREAVFAKDNWTCQKCKDKKDGNLNAHHINNFADFPELRTSIENGITFCKECHQKFHRKYGIKNNTKEQLLEFTFTRDD